MGCEGVCNLWFHYSCAGLKENEYALLEKCKNLFYMCDLCKHKCEVMDKSRVAKVFESVVNTDTRINEINSTKVTTDDLNAHYKHISVNLERELSNFKRDVLADVNSNFKEIKSSLLTSVHQISKKPSYASMVSSKLSVIVNPRDSNMPLADMKSEILSNINPINENINLTDVRDTRKGGIVVSCGSVAESEKFKRLLDNKLGDKYDCKGLTSLNPRLRIVGLKNNMNNDVLLEYIKKGNNSFFTEDSVCEVINIQPTRNNPNIFAAVLQVDVNTYKNILERGKLMIGYERCTVYDAIDLRRCFNCSGFHHLAKQCEQKDPVCPRCSKSHTIKECTSQVLQCVHCHNFNTAKNAKLRTDHAVWDHRCRVYKDALAKFKANILKSE